MEIKRHLFNEEIMAKMDITFVLTPCELEKAYREKEKIYLSEDALQQCNNLGYTKVDDADIDILVERFMEEQDCNVAENDTWYYVITEYFKGKETTS